MGMKLPSAYIQLTMTVLALVIALAALATLHASEAPAIGSDRDPAALQPVRGAFLSTDIWQEIENDSFSQRADFLRGYTQLRTNLDARIRKFDGRRATLPEDFTQDWDFAMKDVRTVRADFDDKLARLKHATPDTWNDLKEQAAATWNHAEEACDKVDQAAY